MTVISRISKVVAPGGQASRPDGDTAAPAAPDFTTATPAAPGSGMAQISALFSDQAAGAEKPSTAWMAYVKFPHIDSTLDTDED